MTTTEDHNPLRTNRAVGLLVVLVLLCWAFLLAGAGMGMSISKMSYPGIVGHRTGDAPMMDMPVAGPGPMRVLGMWWGMMLAMMLPGIWTHLPPDTQAGRLPVWRLASHIAGYSVAWLGFSIAATGVQYGLVSVGLLDPMKLWSTNLILSAALLVCAGAYQFLPTKRQSLESCRNMKGATPSFFAGLSYGRTCLIATTPMMGLLFVGGVMNIYWIVGLTIVVTVEKSLPSPGWFSTVAGASLLAAAGWLLASTI
ncbi:hypothetical protein ACMU_08845 [Actibacterium mucosum KCTC 23349]|uniref:Metal-binding integral membrane protein n=1 Tax=Actibacterium mucosum KCTC 23349 TaxID=1454373 RepID=A0A037ZJT7_9RHOB|nr:DUF2182 domain-containing protein [Actibacterium mucosum]KAJ55869.1 hypothetical protein ACMU_08845 [Actibacterium mucosum KCTC 23349]